MCGALSVAVFKIFPVKIVMTLLTPLEWAKIRCKYKNRVDMIQQMLHTFSQLRSTVNFEGCSDNEMKCVHQQLYDLTMTPETNEGTFSDIAPCLQR